MEIVLTNGIPCRCPFCDNQLSIPRNLYRKAYLGGEDYCCSDCGARFVYVPVEKLVEVAEEAGADVKRWADK